MSRLHIALIFIAFVMVLGSCGSKSEQATPVVTLELPRISPTITTERVQIADTLTPREQPDIEMEDIVFRLSISGCSALPETRSQTAFRIKGVSGLVTALHGVVGCTVKAISEKGEGLGRVTIIEVDVKRDIAILRNPELESMGTDQGFMHSDSWEFPKCTRPGTPQQASVLVVGYPQLADSFTKIPGHANCVRYLDDRVTPKIRAALTERGSPSLTIDIIDIQGIDIVHGHSGSPVLVQDNAGNYLVVGMVVGRLVADKPEEDVPGNGWAVLWKARELKDRDDESSMLSKLEKMSTTVDYQVAMTFADHTSKEVQLRMKDRVPWQGDFYFVDVFTETDACVEIYDRPYASSGKLLLGSHELKAGQYQDSDLDGKFVPMINEIDSDVQRYRNFCTNLTNAAEGSALQLYAYLLARTERGCTNINTLAQDQFSIIPPEDVWNTGFCAALRP